jgi:Xaa-Pro aminopeptidase
MFRRLVLAGALCAFAPLAFSADIWKVAPAAPASWKRDRVADLTAHRKAVAEQVGDKGILILWAAEPRNYAADVDWPYRQENNFFYLTGIDQAGSALVMIPGADKIKEILFMPPSNPAQENWTGHILTPAEGREISGIETIWDARRLNEFLSTVIPQAKTVFVETAGRGGGGRRGGAASTPPAIPVDVKTEFAKQIGTFGGKDTPIAMLGGGRGAAAEFRREAEISRRLTTLDPPMTIKEAGAVFSKLRAVKSPREIELLQHAVDITSEAFHRVYAFALPGTPEYELQAQFEFTFLRRTAHWGYPCIVASGVNATTLHYETNKDSMKAGDLLLIDDAAEFGGYSADVTRTIPVSGKFSKEQADIYRLVWESQQAAIGQAKPGHTPQEVSAACDRVLGEGLYKLGLVTDPKSTREVHIWLNHGISHGIGLNVHDPAAGGNGGAREYQPGMAITMEPGLYFRLDALENLEKTPENEKFIAAVKPAFEKYKGIGVRIEDDVLITTGDPKVMSAGVPSKLEDVEAAITALRKAAKTAPPQ